MSKNESSTQAPSGASHALPHPMKSLTDQFAGMERQTLDRMKTSMHEATRLYSDALDYAAALSAHWRSFALDAVRRFSETPTP